MTAGLIAVVIGAPWLGAALVWAAGRLPLDARRRGRLLSALAIGFSLAGAAASLALLAFAGEQTVIRIPMGPTFGDLTFAADGLGVLLTAIATVIGSLAVIFSVDYMHGDPNLGRYYFLVLLFIGAMAGLALTTSLFFLFVYWEITALCSFALISYYNDDPKAVAGGVKALIITQLGGVGLLALALAVYAQFGTYEFSALFNGAADFPAGVLALIAFCALAAAAAKSAQFPFHTWLPDAMEAPTPISALIHAATMVNAGVYLLARFFPVFSVVPGWQTTVIAVGVITALLAALMAAVAYDLKRVLAYSTVSQLGYMVYAIGVGGVFTSMYHLLSHAVFKALLFLAAGAVIHALGTRDMRRMGAAKVQMPFVRLVFILGALALAGIPPLNGFWSKELVLEVGLVEGPTWAYATMLAGAGITGFYTLRMVWMVFFAPSAEEKAHIHPTPGFMAAALAPLALGSLTTWLLAGPLSQMMAASLPYHDLHAETTTALVIEILTAPATALALGIVVAGAGLWAGRGRLGGLARSLSGFGAWARDGFGFERVNTRVVESTQAAAEELRKLHTGRLNWNLVGVIGGLVFVLAWLAWVTRA